MRISVIIPAHNSAAVIDRAIVSALGQTMPPEEIVVVDDGSTDGTRARVSRYGDRVKYLWQANAGPSAARNRAVGAARGEWVAFLDADDAWQPDKLQRQWQALEAAPGAALAYTHTWFVYDGGHRDLRPSPDARLLWPQLRYRNALITSSVLVRRDQVVAAGGFDERLRVCEDWDLWVRLYRRARFVRVDAPLVDYHITPASASTDIGRMLSGVELMTATTLLDDLSGPRKWLWRRRIMGAQLYCVALTARESGRSPMSWLLRSVAQWPLPTLAAGRYFAIVQAAIGDRRYARVSGMWKSRAARRRQQVGAVLVDGRES
jgi:hypothetical protein